MKKKKSSSYHSLSFVKGECEPVLTGQSVKVRDPSPDVALTGFEPLTREQPVLKVATPTSRPQCLWPIGLRNLSF